MGFEGKGGKAGMVGDVGVSTVRHYEALAAQAQEGNARDRFHVGDEVVVAARGGGRNAQGVCKIVSMGPKRARLSNPNYSDEFTVQYEALEPYVPGHSLSEWGRAKP